MPPLDHRIQTRMRSNIWRLFENTKGCQKCRVYVATQNDTNVYGDEMDTDYSNGVESYCFIELNTPIKIAKAYGWWKEGESIPILMYMPWHSDYQSPKKGDRVEVGIEEGFMRGMYEINHTKMFGQDQAICWIFTVSPVRTA